MTMLDDDRLASLFARAGAAFEVPATGPDDILARAAGRPGCRAAPATGTTTTDARGRRPRRRRGRRRPRRRAAAGRAASSAVAGRHRVLSVAACIVVALVVAGTRRRAGAQPRRSPTLTSSLPRTRPGRCPCTRPTTTVPPGSGAAGHHAAQGAGTGALRANATSQPGTAASASAPAATTPHGALAAERRRGPVRQDRADRDPRALTVGRGDLGRTMTQLTALAGAYGGFVANSQTQSGAGTGGAPYGSVTLQVPVDSFSAVLKQAQALGKTSDLTTKATDVTGQYVDLQARITALEASRQQYLTILAKATTVGDVLAVQEQLDTIQSQIEQLQGQLQVLTERDVVLDADGDGQRGHAAAAARARCPSPAWCGPGTTASAASSPASRAWSAWPARCSSRCCCLGVAPGRRPRPVAALPAPQPRSRRPLRAPMAAASGMPGIVTTPTPPDGPASSLTAIGPEARTMIGIEPGRGERRIRTRRPTLPAASVPVATDVVARRRRPRTRV